LQKEVVVGGKHELTGAEIAHEYISVMQAWFLEALPWVIVFLVTVASAVFVVRFLMKKSTGGDWEHDDDGGGWV
jgi:hypothetical protein